MNKRTMTRITTATATVVAALAILAGCSAYPEAIPRPGAETCAFAGELFSGPAVAPAESGSEASATGGEPPQRLSDAAAAQLRHAVPSELKDDIETILGASAETSTAVERLQEWAIRACGIDVAFASDGTTPLTEAKPNDIRISGEQRTTISITGDTKDALAACEAEVKRGATPSVLVLDQFGTAIVSWEKQGPCAVIDARP